MTKFMTLLFFTAAALVALFSVAVEAKGKSNKLPEVSMTWVPRSGKPYNMMPYRDACYENAPKVWRETKEIKINTPKTECVIYKNESCEGKSVARGTKTLKLPADVKARSIRCQATKA
ncbi:hypothetical protein BGX28_006291 [Mortierella sp. GBA30]|nr:hypothetical protein BGX28_006291 [Mortierella sp. GBA30]